MSGDGSTGSGQAHGRAAARLRGLSFGGRADGLVADPIAQSAALVLVVSVVFSALPGIDIWFSGLFAEVGKGFPLQGIAAFDAFGRLGIMAVAVVLIAAIAAIVWRLTHPERPSAIAPNAILFVLASLVAGSTLTPIVLVAAEAQRAPPSFTHPFGLHEPFVALWQHPGGGCTTDCAAFSVGTMWAVWLVGAAILVPPAWRPTALKALAAAAVLLALNVVARGEAFLSGVLLSAALSALVIAVVHRFTIEKPLPRLAAHRLDDDLARAGRALRRSLGEADWQRLAAKAQSPWRDRLGRTSPLKAATLVLVMMPGLWLVWLAINGELTPLPWVFLIYQSGIWALWMFLATLAVTPARHIFGWSELIAVRRMLGIAGLAYTALHLADYLWLDRFSIGFVLNEFLTRPTIWVATLSAIGIVVLGATSFDEVIRRMGSAAWNRLHYLAYPAIGLGILHFIMAPASFAGPPFLMTGMFAWLMGWRLLHRYGVAAYPSVLMALGLAIAIATFAFEIAWLWLYQGIPAEKTIAFTFELGAGLASTWQLVIIGLTVAALAALFGRKSQSRARLRLPTAPAPKAISWMPWV